MTNNQYLLKNMVSTTIAALLFLVLASLAPAAEFEIAVASNTDICIEAHAQLVRAGALSQ